MKLTVYLAWLTFAILFLFFVFVLIGCDCGCGEKGTLKLRDNNGNYDVICNGKMVSINHMWRFKCDDGREIMNPVNFIIEK